MEQRLSGGRSGRDPDADGRGVLILRIGDGLSQTRHREVADFGAGGQALELGDQEVEFGVDVQDGQVGVDGDRETWSEKSRQRGEAREIAADGLRTALDDMAGHHRAGEFVPRVGSPVVPSGCGTEDEGGGVGDPAADDDIRAVREGRGDTPAAEIGVGRQRIGRQRILALPGEWFVGVEMSERVPGIAKFVETVEQIIAVDMRDGERNCGSVDFGANRVGQPLRIERAGVDDHFDSASGDRAQMRAELSRKYLAKKPPRALGSEVKPAETAAIVISAR